MNLLGPFRLEGDPAASDDLQVWLVWLTPRGKAQTGDRARPIWRSGWSAAFAPDLRILDEHGTVAVTQGQTFWAGGGVIKDDGSVYVCAVDDAFTPTPSE
jgi:hypothetical protein